MINVGAAAKKLGTPGRGLLTGVNDNKSLGGPMKSPNAFIEELWAYAREVPMIKHPWFAGIIEHRWTREQIILGEVQHYLRVRENPVYFGYIAANAVAN